MSLVKSPILTPAKFAANRANARKSTGPRSATGKRRIVVNALKHGRYSPRFRENLVKAGADVELFDWIRARVFDCFPPREARERWCDELLAREVWCQTRPAGHAPGAPGAPRTEEGRRRGGFERGAGASAEGLSRAGASMWCLAWTPWRLGGLETKPRYAVKSTDSSVTLLSPIRIVDPRDGRRLSFWARCPRGTAPRSFASPSPAFYQKVAAWLLTREPALRPSAVSTVESAEGVQEKLTNSA